MQKQTRRKFFPGFKAKVALEAVKNQQTLAELAKKFDVNPVMISKWKAEFLENMAAAFEKSGSPAATVYTALFAERLDHRPAQPGVVH